MSGHPLVSNANTYNVARHGVRYYDLTTAGTKYYSYDGTSTDNTKYGRLDVVATYARPPHENSTIGKSPSEKQRHIDAERIVVGDGRARYYYTDEDMILMDSTNTNQKNPLTIGGSECMTLIAGESAHRESYGKIRLDSYKNTRVYAWSENGSGQNLIDGTLPSGTLQLHRNVLYKLSFSDSSYLYAPPTVMSQRYRGDAAPDVYPVTTTYQGATFSAAIVPGLFTTTLQSTVTVTNPGKSYSPAPIVEIFDTEGVGYGNATLLPQATTTLSEGKIASVTLTDTGTAYSNTSNPIAVIFSDVFVFELVGGVLGESESPVLFMCKGVPTTNLTSTMQLSIIISQYGYHLPGRATTTITTWSIRVTPPYRHDQVLWLLAVSDERPHHATTLREPIQLTPITLVEKFVSSRAR